MEFHYMDDGPFETARIRTGGTITVIGYDPATGTFLAARQAGEAIWDRAANFAPPPPIPAAARQPQIGEVWCVRGVGPVLLAFYVSKLEAENNEWWYIHPHGGSSDLGWCPPSHLTRPATPEEAEPFRPMLEGLKRSLGEA